MYKFVILDYFKRQLKRFLRTDRALMENIIEVLRNFRKDHAVSLGKKIYKVRIGKEYGGKSGGYRLILVVKEFEKLLVPVCIYVKSERENISMDEIAWHLERMMGGL